MDKNRSKLDFDTIVIGAGIVGSGCAYKIAKTGRRTLLLEQFALDHKLGSSHGASRIIRLTHSQPHWVRLAQDAFREWDGLHKLDGGEALYIKNGLLTLDPDWSQTQLRASVLRQFGVPHQVFRGGSAIQRRFPHLHNYDERWSALYEPGAGTMLAENCLRTVQRQYLKLGSNLAKIRDNEQVLAITPWESATDASDSAELTAPANADEHPQRRRGGRHFVEVQTTKRKYLAENVVVAAGGWLNLLVPDLPLRAQPHLLGVNFWRVICNPQLFQPEMNSPNLISLEKGEELFALPGTDYPNAIKFAVHMGIEIADLKRRAELEAPEWAHSLVAQHLAKHFPDVDCTAPLIKDTCIYTMTDDLQFIVDRHPRHQNVFIAGGFSGTGFKFALTIGTVLAQWVNGEDTPPHIDVSSFQLGRRIADTDRPKL
ncbi:hypothetical protein niasHT_005778 [Heterodera trifolii]|uniref:FAD dependent oxidoreductase domain-containing protein n=1 Tax=Heterodera trifolii TaxID=157864 RepID=A0ABD2LTI7_9BILA